MTAISHKALQRAIGKDLSVEEIRSALFDLGMDLKNQEDDLLSVEITAERLDLISIHGLARAIRSLLGLTSHPPQYAASKSDYVVKVTEAVKEVRPRTVCAVIKNLDLDDERIEEIIEVQEKLHSTLARGRKRGAIGIYPMGAIKMPITYTADRPDKIRFLPLNADREMTGAEILEDHETGIAYKHLLEGKTMYPYFIDAAGEILSMPPVINSEKTGRINSSTTDIFIECSGFEKQILDEMLVNLTTMFADMGGDVFTVDVAYADGTLDTTPDLSTREMSLSSHSIKKYLGLDLSDEQVRKLLSRMMYEVSDKTAESKDGSTVWTVEAPAFRFDLWHEVDIIDDIARAYGFNNFELTVPNISTIGGVLTRSRVREEIAEILLGLGFLETYTFAITNEESQYDNLRLDRDRESFIPIANGNENQTMLRTRLLPEQLKCLVHNRSRPLPQKIFEGAFVTLPDDDSDVRARNELRLSALMTDKVVTFTEIRQVLEHVFRSRGVDAEFRPVTTPYFLEGRSAEVFIDGKPIGVVGELHPEVLENFGIVTPVGAFEISLDALL